MLILTKALQKTSNSVKRHFHKKATLDTVNIWCFFFHTRSTLENLFFFLCVQLWRGEPAFCLTDL